MQNRAKNGEGSGSARDDSDMIAFPDLIKSIEDGMTGREKADFRKEMKRGRKSLRKGGISFATAPLHVSEDGRLVEGEERIAKLDKWLRPKGRKRQIRDNRYRLECHIMWLEMQNALQAPQAKES